MTEAEWWGVGAGVGALGPVLTWMVVGGPPMVELSSWTTWWADLALALSSKTALLCSLDILSHSSWEM